MSRGLGDVYKRQITLIITVIMAKMNVEKANEKLLQEKSMKDGMHD